MIQKFKEILAEEVCSFLNSQDSSDTVTIQEMLDDMEEALPELGAVYKAAERYAEYKNNLDMIRKEK